MTDSLESEAPGAGVPEQEASKRAARPSMIRPQDQTIDPDAGSGLRGRREFIEVLNFD